MRTSFATSFRWLKRSSAFFSLAAAALCLAPPSDAAVASDSKAARGLELFIHASAEGVPGAKIPIHVVAYGFPAVTTMVPLSELSVEALWDPESLGPGQSAAPPPVRVTTDKDGRAQLDVPIPPGDERELKLLIGIQAGEHSRTRIVTVRRIRPYRITLHVSDPSVVPGSTVPVWAQVTDAATGEPIDHAPVELQFNEYGHVRKSYQITTDRAGMASTNVRIPWIDESVWGFSISGWVPGGLSPTVGYELSLREETPGKPQMWASFSSESVKAGEQVSYSVIVRDAVNQPVSGLPVRVWIGPKGTEAPTEKAAWEKASMLMYTTASGRVEGETQAPRTVIKGTTTSLQLVARTEVDGHALDGESMVMVGYPHASAELFPEAGVVIPGLEQRMLLRVLDGYGKPVSAPFVLEADGLQQRVKTDDFGEAEVIWKTPVDLGAFRKVGPCAGGVAAAVVVRAEIDIPALGRGRDPFELCVAVDRETTAMVRPEKTIVMPNERVRVQIVSAKGQPGGAWSVLYGTSSDFANARGVWVEDGEKGTEITVPDGATGVWAFSAWSPNSERKARLATGGFWVRPAVLPKIIGKMVSGRAAPGGEIELEAEMTDGKGNPIIGKVAAVMVDRFGGGTVDSLKQMDARLSLCNGLRAGEDRCDALLEGGAEADAARRALLSGVKGSGLSLDSDPGGHAAEDLKKAFGEVLRSLEGAVFEATESPERLQDVRRKGNSGEWVFNPELMTLVTAAMNGAPETPGGEPLSLSDLVAVDPQVTFDNVARRVTRLKLFRVLMQVREFRHEHRLDPEEPALKDPNAILRKLVRDGVLDASLILDPWGGTIQFMKASGPPLPFLTAVRGFELRSPGPDKQLGTADDVKDPFQRVVRSGTPYAMAVDEDRIVDAKVEMEVGDATISAWENMFQELTGTALGNAWGSMSGSGFGAGGRGEGIGLGSIGTVGHGRGSYGISMSSAVWTPPVRTDAQGRARIRLKLGDAETTWRIALLGVPDTARPAVTALDVPVVLPISARVDAGSAWVVGDLGDVALTIRNRSAKAENTTVLLKASGSVVLSDARQAKNEIIIPAGGSVKSRVRLKATRTGHAELSVEVRAPSFASDKLTHRWDVKPQGEPVVLSLPRWVESQMELTLPVDSNVHRPNGAPRLIIERGDEAAIRSALSALNPDGLNSLEALADSLEAAARVERWAVARGGEQSALKATAKEIKERAAAKLRAVLRISSEGDAVAPPETWSVEQRLSLWSPMSAGTENPTPARCPDTFGMSPEHAALALEIEPPPLNGVRLSCWDAFVTEAVYTLRSRGDEADIARAVLALIERPHRVALAANLADVLRDKLSLSESGEIALSSYHTGDRAFRAMVYAALVRSASLGKPARGANAAKLLSWLKIQVDALGGYGSSGATKAAVQAMLAMAPAPDTKTTVTVTSSQFKKEMDIPLNKSISIQLPFDAQKATLAVQGAPVIARYEQPMLRLWSRPPESAQSPIRLETTWPSKVRASGTGPLRVSLNGASSSGGSATVDVRIPLPPGVSLASPISNVRQIQGVLSIRKRIGSSRYPLLLDIPLRFDLSGTFTVPESRARLAFEDAPFATAPARPLTVGASTK